MPKTVSIFQVGELNRVLEDCGLGYRIHLHDLCGGQSFSVEELPGGSHDFDALHAELSEFFGSIGATVSFDVSDLAFRLADE